MIVWRAQPIVSSNTNAAPGEVIVAQGDDLFVSCGEQTTLRLIEVQPQARKRMTARDLVNGLHVKVGDRFG